MPRIARALTLCVLSGAFVTTTWAQTSPASVPGVLINSRDLALFAGATAATAALSRFDVRIARTFGDSSFHLRHPGLTTAAKRTSLVTETVLMLTGSGVWAIARLSHDRGTADVAFHTTEAVASGAAFIQVIRGALGRARPYVIDEAGERRDADPYEFQLLHGFTSFNYRSFPSMHAMASFGAASALVQEMRVRHAPLRAEVAPLLYTAAAMPGLARMYLDEHWSTDIALGVFLGVFSGQKAVLYSHAHPNNRIDRIFLKPTVRASVTIDGGGVRFGLVPF
jgi:membrane-associated phospholipid phosphatase